MWLGRDDIFSHRFPKEIISARNLLVIGNPPWVTNSQLGAIAGQNVPHKTNIRSLSGLDAVTGKSNFDIAEFIILRLIESFAGNSGMIAMLCKNTVIKNIVDIIPRKRLPISTVHSYAIDARRDFGVSADASLLVLELGAPAQ